MGLYQLQFDLPDAFPFDQDDWHWQAYGEVILPIVETNQFRRFWFSRYGGLKQNPHLLLRYEADQKVQTFPGIQPSTHHDYDLVGDLGSQRFFGTNQRFSDQKQKAEMIFDFLHLTAQLTLSQLSHKDKDQYWVLENSSDRGNNHFGSPLESIHHLFCNSSATPIAIALVHTQIKPPGIDVVWPAGLIPAKNSGLMRPDTQIVRIEH